MTTEACSPYFGPLIESLAAVCEERDANLVVFTDAFLSRESGGESAARLFAAKLAGPANVDALIVPALGNSASEDMITAFLERFRTIPICTLSLGLPGYSDVQVDNEIGFRGVVEHLVEVHGLRRFVLLARPPEHAEGRVRGRAYREKLASYGIEPLPDIVVPGDPTLDPDIICRALAGAGVDAIVAVDDYLIPALMQALETLKLRVPEDVAVTGCDDSDIARGNDPPLTTILQPFLAMLEAAVTSLFQRLDGERVPLQDLVPPELVVRRSCGCNADRVSIYTPAQDVDRTSLSTRLAEARAGVLAAWKDVPGLRLNRGAWEDGFYTTCTAELTDDYGERRATLARWVQPHVANGGDGRAWDPVLSILKRAVMPLVVKDPTARARAEAMILRFRAQISDAEAGRARGLLHRSEVLGRQQAVAALQLLRNLDRDRLIASLPGLFQRLGVHTFWFSTYPDDEHPEAGARLGSAMVKGHPVDVDTEPDAFLPQLLVPQRHQPTERYTWMVSPVHDDERQLGLLVCEYMHDPGATFDIMTLQLGAALHGAWLVRRVAEEVERRQRAERARLEREIELARRIQTALLPRNLQVRGLDVATCMLTATEVGGDYFDVIPLEDGCFLGIGDVVGHGLDAGLVMLMVQSAVATAVAIDSNGSPRQAYVATNHVLHDNIRNRMDQDHHVTLSLLRYHTSGRLVFTGEHEDMLVFRAKTGQVETVRVEGVWVGLLPDVSELIDDREIRLEPGDVFLLYTDGVTQALSAEREMFGVERLVAELCALGRQPAAAIRDGLLAAVQRWMPVQNDDLALVVARYVGTGNSLSSSFRPAPENG